MADKSPNVVPTLISLIPFLWGGKGHMYGYHLSVGRAARLLGWKHTAVIAATESFSDLPEGWEACLDTDSLESPGIRKLFVLPLLIGVCRFARSISRYLHKLDSVNTGPKILFLERFNPYQLLSLTLSLSLSRYRDLQIWLLYRHRPDANDRYKFVYLILTKIISKRYKEQLQLLTDSELLKKSLSPFFRLPVTVMPIPHTVTSPPRPRPDRSQEIVCWWAGPPREAKGLQNVRYLLSLTTPSANALRLVVAKSSELVAIPDGMKLELINDALSPSEYAMWLFKSDMILLPYDAHYYREETSGIFIEAVVAGKIPVVSDDTWMAFELRKYNLDELIVDWRSPGILAKLAEISKRRDLKHKIDLLREEYSKYHNEGVYASTMKEIYDAPPA
jgi:hypothetical protein